MSVLNDGRNEIRVNNSDGKCLLENWVEEVTKLWPERHLFDLNGRVSKQRRQVLDTGAGGSALLGDDSTC